MSSPEMRRRAGAHRTSRSVVAALLPSALAVLAVAALITSLAVWRGQDAVQPPAAASTAASSAAREAISKAASSSAAASPRPTATKTKKTSPGTPAGSATAPTGQQPADPADFGVQVVVLNQTSRSGLAGQVAGTLRDEGWPVPAVGNFRGTVPATTVYYPDGQQEAAQALAESLPTPPRTRPRFGNLSTTRLTVVVTADYPG